MRHPNSKKNQPKFWQILSPKNSFAKTLSPIKAPPHCPETSWAEPQKEKCPFHFRKNPPRENQKSKEHFFFWGCRVKRGGGGAFVERTIQFRFTTHAERETSFVLEIGASLVQ